MVLMTKRLIRGAIKTVAGIAVLVFLLARMRTDTGLLLFIGSIVVLLVCFGLLKFLEDDDDNTGYWPTDPKT
jgi:O-antigen ligase